MYRQDDRRQGGGAGSRRRLRWSLAVLTALSVCLFPAGAAAQEAAPEEGRGTTPGDVVEAYMQRLGLKRLQAQDLATRLEGATGQEKVALAERLAKLYVLLLSEATTQADRRMWEERSRELLRMVPDADSFELRLGLIKTLHLQATETAERHRLRLATPEEVAESERVLRTIKPQLDDIAQRVNRRVEQLEQLEERGETSERLTDELSDGRRVRSQAFYYLGWTSYYLGFLTGSDEAAADAQKSFGWLLNSKGGRAPSLDRIPKGLFKYEHVARSAAGVGLATALRGNHPAALAWLNAIEDEQEVPEGVRANLVTWRIAVLASSKRWADLNAFVQQTRNADRAGGGPGVRPLALAPARLLAVSALEADRSLAGDIAEPLAAIAMSDLVANGEISHLLDLVQRYGTAPIGEKGFVVNYVRGIQQYEKARQAHKAVSGALPPTAASGAGATPDAPATSEDGVEGTDRAVAAADLPTTDADTVAAYRLAASLLQGAVGEADAGGFRSERAKASMLWGFSLFYSGDLEKAADRFTDTGRMAATPEQSEEAMWLAVLSLDHAVETGAKSLVKRRDEAAALFLQTHPESVHAPKLLLRRAIAGALEPEEAVRILMGVEKGSGMYEAARQHAARLLYRQYRTGRGSERDFAAMRFVEVAEETLNMDRRIAMDPENEGAAEAAQRIVSRVRQILDALLGTQNPDPGRAEAALETLTSVAGAHKLDIADLASEIEFRRVQIALAKGEMGTAGSLAEGLQREGGEFASAADQLMYRRALLRRQGGTADEETLREIVRHGGRLVTRMLNEPDAMKDNVVLSLHQVVAEIATELWTTRQDGSMRDVAIEMDTRMLAAQPRNQGALRRLASNADAAGDPARALECWRTLMSGLEPGSGEWFEARYESLRLLAGVEARRAKEALMQHVVLYPDYGPEPWGMKLRKLEEELKNVPVPAAPSPADGGKSGGSGT